MKSNLRIALGLAMTATATLMLELVLLRVFDAILYTNMAYMIISCALFAFGLAGVYASLRPIQVGADVGKYIGKVSLAFGAFSLFLLPLINVLPFDFKRIGPDTAEQLLYFGILYLGLTAPFFLSGLIFTAVFSAYAGEIRRLYFFDLCGAALGCVIIIPFVAPIGPGGLLFLVAALSIFAAVLFIGDTRLAGKGLAAVAIALVVVPFARTDGYYDFRDYTNKRGVRDAREAGDIEMTRWDPIAKIDVINTYKIDDETGDRVLHNRLVAYDGGSQSSRLYPFDGNFAALRQELEHDFSGVTDHFWNRSVFASHWLKADSGSEVLIIGSAAGQETKAALLYNARSVDAVEMVRAVVDLSKNHYGEYIGGIFDDPRVNTRVGEGRTYLRSTDKEYDIIQIFSNHTTSSMAAGNGAEGPNYLQTEEAYREYFSSLKPNGMLHINHHVYPRMIATAAVAWRELGRKNFRDHVIVYERPPADNIPLVLFKMSPWTKKDVGKLSDFMLSPGIDSRDTYVLSENPLDPDASFLSGEFYSGEIPAALLEKMPFNVTPSTDDQPYFNFLRKEFGEIYPSSERFLNTSTADLLNSQLTPTRKIPRDLAHLFVTGAASIVFAVLFILVPLFFSSTGRARWRGEFTSLFYFSCLGAGFIIIELTFIQVFMKLIGYPLYTYSVVIFTVLLAAGLGSAAAERLGVSPVNRWHVPYVGTLLFGALLWLVHPYVFDAFLASSMFVRVLVAGVMIFPMSFFMGMALPLGILAIKGKPAGAVAWAWGMNGLFTTIGGLAAVLMAIFVGFKATLIVAFVIYFMAGLAFKRLGRLANASA